MNTQATLAPRMEQGSELVIAGVADHYRRSGDPRIAAQWQKLAPKADKIQGRVGHETYGVVDLGNDGFDYTVGVQVAPDAKVDGLSKVKLPKRRYAVFTHKGDISALPQTMDRVWREWQPKSGEQIARAPFYERYDDRFDPKAGKGEVELWVPLEH